jgi:drug/metabolite transporter (DMT)-like permease
LIYLYPVALARGQLLGMAVALLGVLANGASSILGRDMGRSRQLHPLAITVVSMGIGAAALLGAGVGLQGLPKIGLQSWAIVAWLAVVNTAFAFTLWNHTLQTLSATESTVINGTMLIWIPVLAVLFLGERITGKEAAGLVVVGIGTLFVQLRLPDTVSRLFAHRRSD